MQLCKWISNLSNPNIILLFAYVINVTGSCVIAKVYGNRNCKTFISGNNNNNNDRLTAFDPGQPG